MSLIDSLDNLETTVEEVVRAIKDAADRDVPAGLATEHDAEVLNPWTLSITCEKVSRALEQLSFVVGDLADGADTLVEQWRASGAAAPEAERAAQAMVVQLERAARDLRRGEQLAGVAGSLTMQPAVEALVNDLAIVKTLDDGRFLRIALRGWSRDAYRVEEVTDPLEIPYEDEGPRADVGTEDLAEAVAEMGRVALADAEVLASDARRSLHAMAEHRDSAKRGSPTIALMQSPPVDDDLRRATLARFRDDLLIAAVADITDRDGGRESHPIGVSLALALHSVARDHPDGTAGLLYHPEEIPDAVENVKALLTIGRDLARSGENDLSTITDLVVLAATLGANMDDADRALERIVTTVASAASSGLIDANVARSMGTQAVGVRSMLDRLDGPLRRINEEAWPAA